MRNPTMRSDKRPNAALVSGSMATRMVLQSWSSSRRKSSVDHGCRKAARSITITSSRSSGRIRRTSSLGRARTAISAAPRHASRVASAAGAPDGMGLCLAVERVEHPHVRALAQIGQQLGEQPFVFLPRQLLPHRLALRLSRQGAPVQRLDELAVPQLRRELEPVVEVARHADLAREHGRDLLVGELQRSRERLPPVGRAEAPLEARHRRLDLGPVEVEELEPVDLGQHDALLDKAAQGGGEQRPVWDRLRDLPSLLLDQPDAGLGGELGERDRLRLDHRHPLVHEPALARDGGAREGRGEERHQSRRLKGQDRRSQDRVHRKVVTTGSPSGQSGRCLTGLWSPALTDPPRVVMVPAFADPRPGTRGTAAAETMAEKDLYATLGVDRGAGADEINKAYRKLAKKLHQEVNPGDKKSEERFKEVSSAFEVLGDTKKRALYDEFGDVALRSGFDEEKARAYRAYRDQGAAGGFAGFGGGGGGGRAPGGAEGFHFEAGQGFDPNDLGSMFGDLFARRPGGREARARSEPTRGEDVEVGLTIDLRDAVLGSEREMSVLLPSRCPECHGSGAKPGSKPRKCPQCNGTGEVRMANGLFRGPCPRCQGEGTLKDPCPRCEGAGVVEESKRLTVKIPAGVETGSRVRLAGKGTPGLRSGEDGDP